MRRGRHDDCLGACVFGVCEASNLDARSGLPALDHVLEAAKRIAYFGRAVFQDGERHQTAEIPKRSWMPKPLDQLATTLAQVNAMRRMLTDGVLTAMLEMAFVHRDYEAKWRIGASAIF